MRRVVVLCLFLMAIAVRAQAAPITVSGDSNVISNIGSQAGNQTFFMNLLSGGANVLIRESNVTPGAGLNAFYNGQGVASSLVAAGAVSAVNLAGVQLFVGLTSSVAYSPAEVAALQAFVAGGGAVFLSGEHSGFPTHNAVANALLAALGSGLSIGGGIFDGGFHNAVGPQITNHFLAFGVNSFNYAAYAQVLGGAAVFLGTDLQTAIIASEGDRAAPIPEPISLLLFGSGAAGLVARRRKSATR